MDAVGYDSNATNSSPCVPVAICGMGMRLPGGIRSDTSLYNFLAEGRDARTTVPDDRYNIRAYHSAHSKPGSIVSEHGYFLVDVDLAKCDLTMFNMTPGEACRLDPNQRLLLETVREAFETAGECGYRGKAIGTFAGVFSDDWQDMQNRDVNDAGTYQLTGKADFMLANRISYEYDLTGPSITYKSACSSSGIALHQAIQAIRLGEISSAIVGGANLIFTPGLNTVMSATMALSPTGSCRSFDASADGYARAEGITCLFIKRLDLAITDGNPIRAVIRGSSSNSDGRTAGLSVPSPAAHEALIRQAYQTGGVDLADTPVVECHGTGTKTGDPLELSAIANCFGSNKTYICSIKPNVGHSEGASALTSVMKAVVALENRTVLPNIKFTTPNPDIPWDKYNLIVPTSVLPWPEGRKERISVNSFGFGGSNSHFILESARSFGIPQPPTTRSSASLCHTNISLPSRHHLLLFSANSEEALDKAARAHQDFVRKSPLQTEAVAYTLAERREYLKYKAFSVVKERLSSDEQMSFVRPSVSARARMKPSIAFVFTGQGSQWPSMGRELMQYPAFRDSIDAMDTTLQSLEHAPTWTIRHMLTDVADHSIIGMPEYSQPVCTALQVGLVDLLTSCGVVPSSVIGHSSGEIAAAYAAGSLSSNQAIIIAFYRGFVCKKSTHLGGMAAIGLGTKEVQAYLSPGVTVACENSASSVTLSGDSEMLDSCLSIIQQAHPDVFVRKLKVGIAYHSDYVQEYSNDYYTLIKPHLSTKKPVIPFFSTVHKTLPIDSGSVGDAAYWQENMENPVFFHSGVQRLLHESRKVSIHLEIGPHSTLAGPLRQIYKEQGDNSIMYQCCLTRNKDNAAAFLNAVGQLYCAGVTVRLPVHNKTPQSGLQVVPNLPPYPWQYKDDYWNETRVMANWRFRKHPKHDLLGLRTLESSDIEPTWRNVLHVSEVPWLRDHCVDGDIIFPAASYVSMAGAAISQIKSSHNIAYTVREVHFITAMLLSEDNATEILTTLKPRRLTVKENSVWWEFSISSYDGRQWSLNCHGLVLNGSCNTAMPDMPPVQELPREVSSDRWYSTLNRVGFNYGPRFRGMQRIKCAISGGVASAILINSEQSSQSRYAMHPTTLDNVLQTWSVTQSDGIPRQLKRLTLPTLIDELYVNDLGSNAVINTITVSDGFQASSIGKAMGLDNPAFILKGLRGTPVAKLGSEPGGTSVQYMQWKPDIRFQSMSDLLHVKPGTAGMLSAVERFYILCATEAKEQLAGLSVSQPHFTKFLHWLDKQVERFGRPNYPMVDEAPSLVRLTGTARQDMMVRCLSEAERIGAKPLAQAVWRTYTRLGDILAGNMSHLDSLLEDGLLQALYDWINERVEVGKLFSLLGNNNPQMRILEVGAGTGGLTSHIMNSLQSDYGERLFLSYTYTDVSPGFFAQAQARFAGYSGIEYKILDISKDPTNQGFTLHQYDIVLASNVLHATPSIIETLRNCHKLLKPDGRLFLQELSPVLKSINFVMGLFSGWWLGEQDGRPHEPYLTPVEWDVKLREAGFGGVESLKLDGPDACFMNANMMARPAAGIDHPRGVVLVTKSTSLCPLAEAVKNVLDKQKIQVMQYAWEEAKYLSFQQDIISFLDVAASDSNEDSKPMLQNISKSDFDHLVEFIGANSQSALLWLTHSAQIACRNPYNAQILGFARTCRVELGADFATLELEHTGEGAACAVVDVLCQLQRERECIKTAAVSTDLTDPEVEYAWVDGLVHISRVHWSRALISYQENSPSATPDALRLVIAQHGLLNTAQWREEHFGTLGSDEVRVRMVNIGLNFRDLIIALDVLAEVAEDPEGGVNLFGAEGTGYITEIGSDVQDLHVGDRVMSFGSTSRGFATVVQRPSACCVKIPPQLTDDEAATMPAAYFTALYCLVNKANLQRGQTVLIHSAAGGVGIAAIHIARWLGAEIYATVGTEEKKEFLVTKMGLSSNSIFSSRNEGFLDAVIRSTCGRGVDVVLNSLSGELLHASWKCVAETGCMVEIGKRDLTGYGKLSMSLFNPNRTFACVDIARIGKDRTLTRKMLQTIVQLYVDGHIHPIQPINLFAAKDIESALRFMQKAQHKGKIVIRFPDATSQPLKATMAALPAPRFRNDASYVLIGGLGGLGKAIASWMVRHGARSLIFLSRSGGQRPDQQQLTLELQKSGCVVRCYAGSVTDETIVQTIVRESQLTIAGVMQMAMVLNDMGTQDMDIDTWYDAVRPKVDGTWNLHRHLPKALDFFVLFSSISGLLGYFGQANYASANSFLDSFVQYRHSHGLPASVINIGPLDDVGYVAEKSATRSKFSDQLQLTSEQEFLDLLQLAIAASQPRKQRNLGGYRNPAHIINIAGCKFSMVDPRNTVYWKRDPRMSIYRNVQQFVSGSQAKTTSDSLRALLIAVQEDIGKLQEESTRLKLVDTIMNYVSNLLIMEVNDMSSSQNLADLGVDSLVAIELKNWWKRQLGLDITVLELLNGGSFNQLGDLAILQLKQKLGS